MKMIAVIAMSIATILPVKAQDAAQMATLTADGEATVFAAPDVVVVNIGVTTRGERPAAALDANSVDMQAVIDSVLAAGVGEADVATSSFSIGPIYETSRNGADSPPRIVGYSISNQITVRIRDLEAAGQILDQVVAAGANQINGIRFDIANKEPLRDAAMQGAIAKARRKAELMAEAAGVRLVRILSVSAYADAQPQFELAIARAAVPIVGGEQGIGASATMVFEIAPR